MNANLIKFWAVFTRVLLIAIFAQSFFAGVFLSGEGWGRTAHRVNASILVIVTLLAGVAALITLRKAASGKRLAFSLLGLGVGMAVQMAIGQRVADGERLLWLHIPFGVFLIGMTANLFDVARNVGKVPEPQQRAEPALEGR